MDCQKFPVACAVAAATIMVATHEFLDDDETRSALPCNGGGKSHWEEEEDGGDTDENDDDDDADAKGVTMCSLLHTTNNSETSCLSEEDACPCRSPPGILIWGWVSHKSAPKPIHGHGHRCRHRDPVWGRLRLGIVVVVAIAAILVIPWQQNTQQSNTGKSGDSTAFHTTTTTLRKPPPPKPKPNQPVDTNNNNDAPLETGTTNGSEKTNQPAFVYPDTIPSVAWLLSFVGAGSSAYTLAAVAHFSNTSTATNYCGNANNNNNPGPVQGQNQHQEQDWMVPVHPDYGTSGPFVTQQKPWPKHFILTLTHCGNFCTDRCTPMVPTHRPDRKDVLDYAMQCGSGKRIFHNQERSISYDYHTIPKKIVHAIRNPFDSIVRRMLTTVAHTPESRSQKTPIPGMPLFEPHLYTATLEGVRHWCSYLDRLVAASTSGGPDSYYLYLTTSSIQFGSVPCAAEWYRYTQWHTMATQLVTEKLPTLPVHTLWVENYTLAWDTTMTDLMDFLQLDPVVVPMDPGTFESVFSHLDPPSFSEYGHLFDPDIRRKVGLMMRDLASNATWDLIRHYLEPDLSPIPNQTIDEEFSQLVLKGDTEPERIVSGNTTSNNEWKEYALEDDDTITDESLAYNEKFFASTPQAPDDANPQVVWLLSFPNSGTSYTLVNIEQTANVTTGSNYAKDWSDALPIRPEFDSGPFFHKPELRVARNVLTKTHCSGYCDDCPPLAYVSTDADFEQGCLRVELPNRGGDVHYDSSIPVKIVHLFRSPFDNIVARMHLAVKKREKMGWSADQLATFENTKEGLEAWCEYLDQKYAEEESTFFPESVTRYFQELPCHSDWYRYVMWHNHAFNLTKKLNIPIHYVYYEDYTHRYDETLEALLDFLEVSSRQPPIDFYVGKSYESFYDVSHAQKATAMARALGSSETWSHLQHYFEPFM